VVIQRYVMSLFCLASLHMCPSAPMDRIGHDVNAHAVASSQRSNAALVRLVKPAAQLHNLLTQFRGVMRFAFTGAPLTGHVARVVGGRTQEQMSGIYTEGIVASVQNEKTVGNGSVVYLVSSKRVPHLAHCRSTRRFLDSIAHFAEQNWPAPYFSRHSRTSNGVSQTRHLHWTRMAGFMRSLRMLFHPSR
jgi:hypothetical protein